MKKFILSKKWVDVNGHDLPQASTTIFKTFVEQFTKARESINIYRGTNDLSAYRIDENDMIGSFSYKLFMLGVKGERFVMENYSRMSLQEDSFRDIFFNIREKCNDSKFRSFFIQNEDFKSFFEKKGNQYTFVDIIMKCSSESKLKIQDYYYALLQTMDDKVANNGCMVSTTTNIKEAQKFQKGKGDNRKTGIIIVAWIPLTQKDIIIRYNNVNKWSNEIEDKGLPTFYYSPYPYQKEICIKYGIFPHFIIGYSFLDKFVVNPHLLLQLSSEYDINNIVSEGIFIDQNEKFRSVLSQTNYRHYFTNLDDNIRILLDKLSAH